MVLISDTSQNWLLPDIQKRVIIRRNDTHKHPNVTFYCLACYFTIYGEKKKKKESFEVINWTRKTKHR